MSFTSWGSYSKIYALGHRAVKDLTNVPCYMQEKVDGSQFSFGVDPDSGELLFRSKGAIIEAACPEGMFSRGVAEITAIKDKLTPGWTYRGEYLQKPKHNALAYNAVPARNVILFDINTGDQEFLPYEAVKAEAMRLEMMVVPLLMTGTPTLEDIQGFLSMDSCLGGQKIEGVVLKPVSYCLFGEDKKALMGKFVSEAFKEVHRKDWKESNPNHGDVIELIAGQFRTPARWQKAVIHLREAGTLTDSPKDIGNLMAATIEDVLAEEEEAIKAQLWKYAWPKIKRGLTHGLPEWYKEQLLTKQFDEPTGTVFQQCRCEHSIQAHAEQLDGPNYSDGPGKCKAKDCPCEKFEALPTTD